MALVNFTLPFSGIGGTPSWATISPLQTHHATAVNNLLYGPAGHQESDVLGGQQQNANQYYKNDPYSQPQQQQVQNQYRQRTSNNYLPPPQSALQPTSSPPSTSLSSSQQQIQQQQHQQQNNQLNNNNNINNNNNFRQYPPQNQNNYPQTYQQTTRTYGEGSYANVQTNQDNNNQGYYENYDPQTTRNFMQQPQNPQTVTPIPITQSGNDNNNNNNNNNYNDNSRGGINTNINRNTNNNNNNNNGGNIGSDNSNGDFPERPPGFTRVQAGQGARTQVHAILDYDDDEEYYDDEDDDDEQGNTGNQKTAMPTVTPIQGPIFLKNGTVPVVPLFAYPTVNNGTFVQIPIWWTALSVALGLDIRGDIIRGVPCVKRYHQLFCPTAGNSYPIDKIEKFIDDNKALMRRMYGDFEMSTQYGPPSQTSSKKRKRHTDNFDFDVPGVPDFIGKPGFEPDADTKGESYFNKWRPKRQTQSFRNTNNNSNTNNSNSNRNTNSNSNTNRSNQSGRQAANANNNSENTGRVDACESKVEIVTPYWASNSAGKIRAIVNTQHFEQAIHQEVCVKVQTNRCGGDCGCEQKYKWHRLLAYDPDNDCKGIFMDWFLFPSCCVCRCNP